MSAATVAAIAKAAVAVLSNEKTRKALGWVIVAILSPLIVLVVLICAVLSGSSQHNVSAVELCFHGGTISSSATPEYRGYIEDMRGSFAQLDRAIEEINAQCEDGNSLDDTRVKAVFYALYFAAEHPDDSGIRAFTDCFVDYEERTRTVTTTDEEGNEVEVEETYTVAIPVTDMNEVYARIEAAMGITVTPENQSNADSIYNIVLYGTATGTGDWFPGADVPFISVDGFCSPVGANWESIVTSEFGYRRDPFTGETRGHSGMDLAVPTGTPIRAALPGTVTVSQYNAGGYGYYVMIDHGNGLSTLYGPHMVRWIDAHKGDVSVTYEDVTPSVDMYSVQGPTSGEVMDDVCADSVSGLKRFELARTRVADRDVLVDRGGFTGELGFEIYCSREDSEAVAAALGATGKRELQTLEVYVRSLPMEKGMALRQDYHLLTPFEANLGWSVHFDKKGDFVGRAALEASHETGERRAFVGVEIERESYEDIAQNEIVYKRGVPVGRCRQMIYGYTVEKNIGFAIVDREKCPVGTRVTIGSNDSPAVIVEPKWC